jgi:hypothetical protein
MIIVRDPLSNQNKNIRSERRNEQRSAMTANNGRENGGERFEKNAIGNAVAQVSERNKTSSAIDELLKTVTLDLLRKKQIYSSRARGHMSLSEYRTTC